jgi:hypothetical protein
MNELIDEAIAYIKLTFFLQPKIKNDISNELPFQIKNKSSAYVVEINNSFFFFLCVDDIQSVEANNFLHLKRIYAKYQFPIVVVAKYIKESSMKKMSAIGIGWVIPGSYLLIPSLFIHKGTADFKESFQFIDKDKPFGIIPSYLIAYYLSGKYSNFFNSSDVINTFSVSKMAASRTFKELINNGIIERFEKGRHKEFRFSMTRREVWERYRKKISPLSTGFLPVSASKLSGLKTFYSGESALAEYTLLSSPEIQHLGVYLNEEDRYMRPITPATINGDYFFKIMKFLDDKEKLSDFYDKKCMIQIFPYPPIIENNYLNKVFLVLSKFNKYDIRVRASYSELEDMIYKGLY